jgi:sugar lactone lactonase YvrE
MSASAGAREPRAGIVALGLAAALACGGSQLTPVEGCEAAHGIEVDCQFQNPEDLVPSPDGRILVSQYGDMASGAPGSLAIYDPERRQLERLFPEDATALEPGWGDAACPPPDPARFSPHGIDIERRRDGRHQLAVVNHGGRESVELFEVSDAGGLVWRGCVLGPEGAFFNDVVVLVDGGFWVTHMFPHGSGFLPLVKSRLGLDTGWVYAWAPGAGFSKLPGTHAPFPNGLEKSPDERFAYVNTYSTTGVLKVDVTSGEVVARRAIDNLDNSSWGADGRLLVASHRGGLSEMLACQRLARGACGMPFAILALDPDDLAPEERLAHQGAPMGGATVALEHRGALYLGSFAGDRIAIVR